MSRETAAALLALYGPFAVAALIWWGLQRRKAITIKRAKRDWED